MTLTRKDAAATTLTALTVLAYVATHEAWAVPLIGDSRRWAAPVGGPGPPPRNTDAVPRRFRGRFRRGSAGPQGRHRVRLVAELDVFAQKIHHHRIINVVVVLHDLFIHRHHQERIPRTKRNRVV